MPIGNLTSQIFANIYQNEFDRFISHTLKPSAYLRYGDDWLCFSPNRNELETIMRDAIAFLSETLKLKVSVTQVKWHEPISIRHLTHAILALSLERGKQTIKFD